MMMMIMTRSDASRRANGVAAVLTQRRTASQPFALPGHVPPPARPDARRGQRPLASPECVPRAHLRQRSAPRRGRYIWRRDAFGPQPLLSRPSTHNPPPRLVNSRDTFILCLRFLREDRRSVDENRFWNLEIKKKWRRVCNFQGFARKNMIDLKVN